MTKMTNVSTPGLSSSLQDQPGLHRIGLDAQGFESTLGVEFSWNPGKFSGAAPTALGRKIWQQPLQPWKSRCPTAERSVRFIYSPSGTLSEFQLLLPDHPVPTLQMACALARLPIRWVIRQVPAPYGYTGLSCTVLREDGTALTASESAFLKAAVLVFVAQGAVIHGRDTVEEGTRGLRPRPTASTRGATSAGSHQAAG